MRKWTDQLVRILIRDYPSKGSNILSLRKRFANETIRAKAKKLKVKVNKAWKQQHFKNTLDKNRIIRWGRKEIATLKKEYPKRGTKIRQLLKKFTRYAIKTKANVLNIRMKGR